jgi:hypothetical protein
MGAGRTIRGKRGDLTGVRDPRAVRRLVVEGPGVASLQGIGRMTKLEGLTLERLRDVSLAPLADLAATLQDFRVERIVGATGCAAIGSLSKLRLLIFDCDDRDSARNFAAVDLSALTELETLYATGGDFRQPLRLDWVAQAPRLAHLELGSFLVEERDIDVLCRAPALRSIAFTTDSPVVRARLRAELGGRVEVSDVDANQRAPLRTIHSHRDYFSVGIDLAGEWDLETNVEAEKSLRELLERQVPALAPAVAYDTESSAVWLLASDRETLEQVLATVDRAR